MKKKIKLISIFTMLLLLTGCSVNYSLEFSNQTLTEKINVSLTGTDYTDENIDKMQYMSKYEAYAISQGQVQEKYNFDFNEEKKSYTGTFSYTYSIEQFNVANIVHQCYDSFNFVSTEKGYSLVTSDIFRCGSYSYMPVDNYVITITTDYVVNNHNADLVDGNSYIWKIKTNGQPDIIKPIKIDFSKDTISDKLKDELSANSSKVVILILGILLIIVVVVYILYTIKNKKNQD